MHICVIHQPWDQTSVMLRDEMVQAGLLTRKISHLITRLGLEDSLKSKSNRDREVESKYLLAQICGTQ